MGDTLSVGVIGTGRIGQLHAGHLAYRVRGARLAAVSDINEAAAKKCGEALGLKAVHADYRRILDDRAIQAVAICSSTDSHAQIIEEAAAAGKHIFCEKPIALDLARIDKALDAVKRAKVKLQIGFNRRFDPNFRRIRELVQKGAVGETHILKITSRDPSPPPIEYVKVSGGIFLDMMIHDFDMARYIVGSEVQEVYAMGAVRVDPAIGKQGDIDTAVVNLVFKNGTLGIIDNSRKAVYGYDQRVEIFGSAGMVDTANNTPNRTRLSTAQNVSEDLPLFFFVERYTDSYIAEMQSFVECVLGNKEPQVKGIDGKIPVVLGQTAKKSLDEHRPVKVPDISGI